MAEYYPPVGFHFKIHLTKRVKNKSKTTLDDGALALDKEFNKPIDIAFQSISGLNAQLQAETYKEGGENRFEHTLPVRTKYSDLVLKRGVVLAGSSELTQWFKLAFDEFKFLPKDALVQLLGESGDERDKPLMIWNVVNVLPKNWKFGDLNAERGEILIETMELSYSYFEFKEP